MRKVLALVLIALLVGSAFGQNYSELARSLKGADPGEVIARVERHPLASDDPDIADAIHAADGLEGNALERQVDIVRKLVALKALGEGTHSHPGADRSHAGRSAVQDAKRIKSSVLYQDNGVAEDSNWLGRALTRLKNLKWDLEPKSNGPSPQLPLAQVLVPIAWFLLGALTLAFVVLALRQVRINRGLARRAKAILEADEPERTLDEWLLQADSLAAEGKYREAVRALYLACLLRFDEHRVARFIRSETNWEHLRRIEASPTKPATVDFRPPTLAFDLIWYGQITRGLADVEQFRVWYQSITTALAEAKV